MSHVSEAEVGGYQFRVYSFIVRSRYQAMPSENTEDLVPAVVMCRMCR
jgi:hypothetical protein